MYLLVAVTRPVGFLLAPLAARVYLERLVCKLIM